MWKAKLLKLLHNVSLWLFWPGVALIAWGELTPNPPDLSAILAWDKAQHFIAYFGLAAHGHHGSGPATAGWHGRSWA